MRELEAASVSYDLREERFRLEVKYSLKLEKQLTGLSRGNQEAERERPGHQGVPVLTFLSLACQLASIVILVAVVLLLTGIAIVVLAA
jgi:hypothetical protein